MTPTDPLDPDPLDPSATPGSSGIVLAPSFGVPLGVIALGLAALTLRPWWGGAIWLGAGIAVLGLFLLLQTSLLRLEFGGDALLVWRQQSLLRRFPYAAWLGWKLFWPGLPVLFYFREQRSIHLLPVLFDPATLRQQLELHVSPSSSPERPDSPSDL
ncbi:DUF3119 family protein [Cyanobium sp. Alchichica 3B3-8F6]|uniref:DUF3119 family protein n=1 Tax=Synechococcales TaxID=1890424 RepID=UPI000B98B4F2|nr:MULTISPECIES: DUF3119 family protein [Synechococcales]MCP9883155.1 DUF3119 family protein [Cyanobium sp. Alchichica 3B3-8F6]